MAYRVNLASDLRSRAAIKRLAARRSGGLADLRSASAALRAAGPAARPAPPQDPPKTTKGASPFPERLPLILLISA